MTYCVATMSSKTGWETKSVENAMNLHFYYWFVARESQSQLIGKVPSFYSLWKEYGERQDTMISETNTALKNYMQLLFPTADQINVRCNATSDELGDSLYHLTITVTVVVSKISYDLNKIVAMNYSNFQLLDNARLN